MQKLLTVAALVALAATSSGCQFFSGLSARRKVFRQDLQWAIEVTREHARPDLEPVDQLRLDAFLGKVEALADLTGMIEISDERPD